MRAFVLLAVILFAPDLLAPSAAVQGRIERTTFGIVLGDLTRQTADAIVVSHWPSGINDGGGEGGGQRGIYVS